MDNETLNTKEYNKNDTREYLHEIILMKNQFGTLPTIFFLQSFNCYKFFRKTIVCKLDRVLWVEIFFGQLHVE